mgnify:FL=1
MIGLKSGEIKVDALKMNMPSKNNFRDYLTFYTQSMTKAFEKDVYTQCEKFVMNDLTLKSILENPELKKDEKIKRIQTYINKHVSSKHDREFSMQLVSFYLFGAKKFLPQDEKLLAENLKNILADSISSIAKQISSLNLFQKYTELESLNFERMDFKEFISGKKNIDITSPQILRNMSVHDLMILNSFWINRYAKELDSYANGIFAIKTLGVLPKILDNTFDISDINKDALETTLIKCMMLRRHSQRFINDRQEAYYKGTLPKNTYTTDENKNYITYSYVPLAKQLKSLYSTDYQKFFTQLLSKSNNTIENNAILYAELISPVINIYNMKDEILNSLISNLDNSSDIINAGIIPDSVLDDGTQIMLNPNFVCLGLDTKLTFPVREHIKLNVLKDFLVSLQNGNEYIPIYEGKSDFTFPSGEIISAQQILPFTKEQEKMLKKAVAANPNGLNKDFILHLNWLRDSSKVPEKFKSTIIDDKGRKKKSFIRTYVNLGEYEPGKPLQVYIKKDNEYVKIPSEIKKSFSTCIDSNKKEMQEYPNGGDDIEL